MENLSLFQSTSYYTLMEHTDEVLQNPREMLKAIGDEQKYIILALQQLETTQTELIELLTPLTMGGDIFSTVANVGGTASVLIALAAINPILGGIATMGFGIIAFADHIQKQVEKGTMDLDIEGATATANSIGEIYAASNPNITPYDAVTELPAGRRARSTKAKLAESKERQANIAMALETLNNVGEIYAASSPISYDEPATFNDWQNQWFRTLDAQQSILKSGYKKAAMTAA